MFSAPRPALPRPGSRQAGTDQKRSRVVAVDIDRAEGATVFVDHAPGLWISARDGNAAFAQELSKHGRCSFTEPLFSVALCVPGFWGVDRCEPDCFAIDLNGVAINDADAFPCLERQGKAEGDSDGCGDNP